MSIHSDVKLVRERLIAREDDVSATDAGIASLEALRRLEARLLYPRITSEIERGAARAEEAHERDQLEENSTLEAADPAGEHEL